MLNSILAIGSLTGALLAARRERARIRIIILASAFFGVAVLIAALMPTYWTFAASTVLIGFGAVSILTTANGYVQTTTDPELRGRVMALYMAILVGGTPIGAPIVGAVADSWGPRWALGVAAVAAGVAALIGLGWLVFARGMHLVPHPRARWRPVVRFADAPTAAIAIIPTRPVQVVRADRPRRTIPGARRARAAGAERPAGGRRLLGGGRAHLAHRDPAAAPRRRGGAPCARAARTRARTRAPRAPASRARASRIRAESADRADPPPDDVGLSAARPARARQARVDSRTTSSGWNTHLLALVAVAAPSSRAAGRRPCSR